MNVIKTITFSVDKSLEAFPKLELAKCYYAYIYCGRFKTHVSGVRCAGSRCRVPGTQVPGVRFRVSGTKFQVPPGDQVARNDVPDFKDQVQLQNVKNFHIKNILRLNGNYKLTSTFFTTLIFSLCNSLNRL